MRRPFWIIWYAIVLHVSWSLMLLVSDAPSNTTPIHALTQLTDGHGLAFMLLTVGLLAMWSMLRRKAVSVWSLILLLPQQSVMVMTACGALRAILASQYADGVPRPVLFIAADQLPAILAALAHTGAILELHAGGLWDRMLSHSQHSS